MKHEKRSIEYQQRKQQEWDAFVRHLKLPQYDDSPLPITSSEDYVVVFLKSLRVSVERMLSDYFPCAVMRKMDAEMIGLVEWMHYVSFELFVSWQGGLKCSDFVYDERYDYATQSGAEIIYPDEFEEVFGALGYEVK